MSFLKSIIAALAILSTIEAGPLLRRAGQYTLINTKPDSATPLSLAPQHFRRDNGTEPNNQTIPYNQTISTNQTLPNHQTPLNQPKLCPYLHIADYNTLNGTIPDVQALVQDVETKLGTGLTISFINNFEGNRLYAYIVGLGPNGEIVLLNPDGTWYSPIPNSTTIPQQIVQNVSLPLNGQNQSTFYQIPTSLTSGRIYVSEGELVFGVLATSDGATLVEPDFNNPDDPSSILDWSYVELTTSDQAVTINLSYVDFLGLPLGTSIVTADGNVISDPGINATAVRDICNALETFATNETQPWNHLCLYNNKKAPVRVSAPSKLIAVGNNTYFSDYYSAYVDAVYARYTPSDPLTIVTSTSQGNVSCAAAGDLLTCDGANREFPKPSASDIFACNGVFQIQDGDNDVVLSIVPILCAAFERTTLLLDGGDVQPTGGSSAFYTESPTNRYSQLVHRHELNGDGYAFAYDDVHARNQPDPSGLINANNTTLVTITIGG